MILGAALNPFSSESLRLQVEAYADAGFSYVDLAMDHPMDPDTFDSSGFGNLLKKHGLCFYGQTPVLLPFASPYPGVREQAVQIALAAADALTKAGAKHVVLHPDNAYNFLSSEKLIGWNIESFKKINHERPKIQFLVENLHTGIFNRVETMKSVLKALPRFKTILDVAHVHVAQKKQGSPMKDWFSLPVAHMHWSENDGLSDQHTWLGGHAMPWKEWISKIKGKYDGTATIEIYRGLTKDTIRAKKFLDPLLKSSTPGTKSQ